MPTQQSPARWQRDEEGNLYRELTDRERATFYSSQTKPGSDTHGGKPTRASAASRVANIALHWLIWVAASLLVEGGLLVVLH